MATSVKSSGNNQQTNLQDHQNHPPNTTEARQNNRRNNNGQYRNDNQRMQNNNAHRRLPQSNNFHQNFGAARENVGQPSRVSNPLPLNFGGPGCNMYNSVRIY